MRQIGREGRGPEEIQGAMLVFLRDEVLYILDRANKRINSFHIDGTHRKVINLAGTPGIMGILVIVHHPIEWHWNSLGFRLGGPNCILLPDQSMILGTRVYPEERYQTALFEVDTSGYSQALLTFPSGGDTSYPGMIWYNDTLWVSYYSGHERKTAIYLAKIASEE